MKPYSIILFTIFFGDVFHFVENITPAVGVDFSKCVFCFYNLLCYHFRTSRLEVFCKKGVLRNFVKFTGKYLCQSLFFNKVPGLKKRLWHSFFPVNFVKFLRTPFFIKYLWCLLLSFFSYVDKSKTINFTTNIISRKR